MTQLDGKSKDLINENIEKLKEIFPEVFSEGKIDFSKLEEELGVFKNNENERYNFTWNGKSEAKKIALTPSTGTLRPCKEESKDWDTTQNLYIEGDNLEVLKLLQKSYHKKVKMIYIDPPYNTGKDFVYKDNFRDNIKNYLELTGQVDSDGNKLSTNSETSGRYHSDWLNMIYPRLKLARNLLKDDGVIFISIDDNEVANLRKLCDEIFGEDNFVSEFIWEKKKKPSFLHKNVGKLSEYILCYLKNTEQTFPFSIETTTEGKKYPLNNAGNSINKITFPPKTVKFNMDDCEIEPQDMSEGNIITKLLTKLIVKNHLNENEFILEGEWRYSQAKINEIIMNGEVIVISKIPFRPNHIKDGGEIKKMKNNFSPTHYQMETNEDATDQIISLFDKDLFDNPKPIKLLQTLIQATTYMEDNSIILDFFSGSATTAHAVMKLNSEDDGNRKFICVQLPELTSENSEAYKAGYKNICEIGKERIRRAGEKVKTESGKDDLDIGFKVLKLDSSNIKSWDSDFENLETNLLDSVENIKSDRNEEDLLYEILLKYGLDLTLPIEEKEVNGKKLYNIGFGALIICLDSNISIDITDDIIAIKKEYDSEITRVVFKDSGFKNATEKTNIIKTLNQNGIDEVVSV
ncbi:site-specific DNA-methyltransferase [Aliarcobacter lanthieri]|uniref:site-specific DNA-methyltransferase n=1 Tax=Aliarcobacter lanthieri TaxID=1355374 RepID=UPI003AFA5E8D